MDWAQSPPLKAHCCRAGSGGTAGAEAEHQTQARGVPRCDGPGHTARPATTAAGVLPARLPAPGFFTGSWSCLHPSSGTFPKCLDPWRGWRTSVAHTAAQQLRPLEPHSSAGCRGTL